MTAQQVINVVRPLINDTVATYRWNDADLIAKLNNALEELWHNEPTAFYTTAVVTTHFSDITAVGDTVPVSSMWRAALAYHMVFQVYAEDQDATENASISQKNFDLYLKELGA
jgi:hypothetical protein